MTGRFALDAVLADGFPFLTFFPAILLTTLFAGRSAGALSTLLSVLAAWYWFLEPRNSFELTFASVVAILFFLAVAIVDVLVIDLLAKALDKVESPQLPDMRPFEAGVSAFCVWHDSHETARNGLDILSNFFTLRRNGLRKRFLPIILSR